MRFLRFWPALAFIGVSGGCFNPSGAGGGAGTDADTDDSTGGDGTLDSGPTSPSTSAPSTSMTSSPETSESGTEGCSHECGAVGSVCNGSDVENCTEDANGCRVLDVIPCDEGCMDGDCVSAACGDGSIGGSEECDDGNDTPGDGCSDCAVDEGWECIEEPSVCVAPDLGVRILGLDPEGVRIEVYNYGGLASGPYRLDLYDVRPASTAFEMPPAPGVDGDEVSTGNASLGPGASVEHILPANLGFEDGAFFVIVDTMDEIIEQDENDNLSLGYQWSTLNLWYVLSYPSVLFAEPIPDDGTTVSVPITNDFGGGSSSIMISMNITHPDVSELLVELEGPNGAVATLSSGSMVSGANFGGTSFGRNINFGSGADLTTATAPYIGHFQEEAFPASPGFGTWTLHVTDTSMGNAGRLNEVILQVAEFDP